MLTLLTRATSLVWFLLLGITSVSYCLSEGAGSDSTTPHPALTVGLFLLTFAKIRLIIMHFMEVRTAPWPLRIICDLWLAGACSAMLITYLTGIS